ncbi:lymphocyte antigen 96 isoform X1 [Ranitomeya variabilis]|uniref:lymphocyte antigen 96 isoform X1 n=1 Tax=Ranitomeya variabilis TaxID=490064 RepID=UPI0040572CA8
MFNFLLLLLGFGTVKSSTKYFLCDTPKMEAYYEMCDDSFPPVIKLEGCDLSRHTHGNISMKVIPRKNIDRLYATVEIWKESVTVSVTKVELCTGVDDEFDFCGALKGETLTILHQRKLFKRLQLVESTAYIVGLGAQICTGAHQGITLLPCGPVRAWIEQLLFITNSLFCRFTL